MSEKLPHRQLLFRVAELLASGRTQVQVSNDLDLNYVKVSRLASEARASGWLHEVVDESRMPDDLRREYQRSRQAIDSRDRRLLEAVESFSTSGPPPTVQVFHSGGAGRELNKYLERLRTFAVPAAEWFRDHLAQFGLTGVCWGKTVRAVTDQLSRLEIRSDVRPDFFPVCGEPLGFTNLESTSSHLAARLRAIVGRSAEGAVSLHGVAACIPGTFSKEEQELIRAFFYWDVGYRKMFPAGRRLIKQNRWMPSDVTETALVDQLTTLISSVGTAEHYDEWVQETARMARISIPELSELTYGNIGGVFLPKDGLSKADKSKVERINGAWTGIDEIQMAAIGKRSIAQGKCGVVVVAIGANKAHIIKECTRRNLIQKLLIDHDLARALCELGAGGGAGEPVSR